MIGSQLRKLAMTDAMVVGGADGCKEGSEKEEMCDQESNHVKFMRDEDSSAQGLRMCGAVEIEGGRIGVRALDLRWKDIMEVGGVVSVESPDAALSAGLEGSGAMSSGSSEGAWNEDSHATGACESASGGGSAIRAVEDCDEESVEDCAGVVEGVKRTKTAKKRAGQRRRADAKKKTTRCELGNPKKSF